ncbi:MAG: 2-iminoacetate synthase ThiH [Bacteroidota bacterium]
MFKKEFSKYDWEKIKKSIYSKKAKEVEYVLEKPEINLDDFKALISPAAKPFLEFMAKKSNRLTQKRFGKIIQLFLPLYLSNECTNHCVYCGFNQNNNIDRLTLDKDQILKEVEAIKSLGYEHILLVTGEHHQKAGFDYIKDAIELIKPYFSLISIEIQPLEQDEYKQLIDIGLNTVYVYQETYNKIKYPDYHPAGKKSDFYYRLDTPDRVGKAGIHRIGIGCLLGLEDWRTDSYYTAEHLKYLERKYWRTRYSISFPRLRPNAGNFQTSSQITDQDLVQLICAYRLLDPEVELSISVRESMKFRDHIMKLGITSMSAGSRTEPGGYALNTHALEQFEVHDNRTPAEIEKMIKLNGYEPVWKDWDRYMQI